MTRRVSDATYRSLGLREPGTRRQTGSRYSFFLNTQTLKGIVGTRVVGGTAKLAFDLSVFVFEKRNK